MPELRALHASFNQLTGVLPAEWTAPALQQLGVRANMFAGPLPACAGVAAGPGRARPAGAQGSRRSALWLSGARMLGLFGAHTLPACFF